MNGKAKARSDVAKDDKKLKDAWVTTRPCVGRDGVFISLWADNGARPVKQGTVARLSNRQAVELARDLIMMVKINQEENR